MIWKWQFSFGINDLAGVVNLPDAKGDVVADWGYGRRFHKWKKQTPLPLTEVVAKTLQIALDKRNQPHN